MGCPPPPDPFGCVECKKGAFQECAPVLWDVIWLSIASKKDFLCLSCAEKLLGRPLGVRDLKRHGGGYHLMWNGQWLEDNAPEQLYLVNKACRERI